MKKILLFPLLFSSAIFSQSMINKEYFINLLKEKKYGQVFSEAMAMRKDKQYGKCAILDYFIAKSFCLDNYPEKGKEWLRSILQHYALNASNRKFIEDETGSRESMAFNRPRSLNIYTVPLPSASVSAYGKMGYRYDCNAKDRKIEFNNNFSEEDLENRLFELNQKDQAMAKTRSLLTDEYEVNSRDRYVLVSLKSEKITPAQVLDITTSLEKAYSFYVKHFNLRAPDKIITVYLLPDETSLYETARLVHGANLPREIYGYSLLTDLSLLGIATPKHVGTLYHELFHLVVRTDIGDIPAWLDEGLASLYSVSFWQNDTLYGYKKTWRIQQLESEYLHKTSQAVPSLTQLFSYNWQQFNGGEDVNLCQAAINYALANHLMIWLQEQNKLQLIVNAYKKRMIPESRDSIHLQDDFEILESALGYSTDSLQKEFTRWFINAYNFNIYLPGGDKPAVSSSLTDQWGIGEYKNSVSRMLDDLKEVHGSEKIGVAAFEKRLSSIYRSYTKIDKKLQKHWKKWRRKHKVKAENDETAMNRQQVQQNAPGITFRYPPPAGKTKEKIDAYQKKLDNEKAKMKELYFEVKQVIDKYLHPATLNRTGT